MKIEIKSWITGSVLFEGDFSSLDQAVVAAVKNKTDLRGAVLHGAVLRGADLSGADLSDKIFQALPRLDNPDRQILDIIKEGHGTLNMGDWHKCETTHCRAGWYVHKSGPAGLMLEALWGPAVAGAIIFSKAYPGRKIPNFYAGDAETLADMERNASLPNP